MNDSKNNRNSVYSIEIYGYVIIIAIFLIIGSVVYYKSESKIFIIVADIILLLFGLGFWYRIINKAQALENNELFLNENRINKLIKYGNFRIRELFDFQKQSFFDQFSESYAFYSNILIMLGMVSSAISIFWNLAGNLSTQGEKIDNITKILNIAPEIFIFTAMALIYAMVLSSLAKYLRGKIFYSSFEFVNQILKDIENLGSYDKESDKIYQALAKVVDEKIVTNLNNLATSLSETLTNVMDKKIVSDLKSLISNFSESVDNSTENIEKIGNSINSLENTIKALKCALNETANEIDSYLLNAKNASIAVNNLTIHLTSLTEKLESSVNYFSDETEKIVSAFNQLNEEYLKKMAYETEKYRKSLIISNKIVTKGINPITESLMQLIENMESLEKETSPNQKLFLDSMKKISENLSQINNIYKKIYKETCILGEIKGILETTNQLNLS